ncbi:MAG: hypothetical protein QG571_1783, partial [Pseudomonadota bacterium]|nr:hypothetical protein [Pseudomonadota bacterium]
MRTRSSSILALAVSGFFFCSLALAQQAPGVKGGEAVATPAANPPQPTQQSVIQQFP